MSNLDGLIDAQKARLFDAAMSAQKSATRDDITFREALGAFLNMTGLPILANAVIVGTYAFQQISHVVTNVVHGVRDFARGAVSDIREFFDNL